MRARNLKSEFFRDEKIIKFSFPARILYTGLWCFADREGRFEWKPGQMKIEIFPEQEIDISPLLTELLEHGVIVKYRFDEQTYGWIPNFSEHQRPHPNEAKSKIPPFSKEYQCDHISQYQGTPKCNYIHSLNGTAECQSDIIIPDIIIDNIKESAGAAPLATQFDDQCKAISVLPAKKDKFNPWQWVTWAKNHSYNQQAISHTLDQIIKLWPEITTPWTYATTIIAKESGNFYEREKLAPVKKEKQEWLNLVNDLKTVAKKRTTGA